jgi:hypothetical protein
VALILFWRNCSAQFLDKNTTVEPHVATWVTRVYLLPTQAPTDSTDSIRRRRYASFRQHPANTPPTSSPPHHPSLLLSTSSRSTIHPSSYQHHAAPPSIPPPANIIIANSIHHPYITLSLVLLESISYHPLLFSKLSDQISSI